MTKSYVSMEQHVCVVCGKAYDTGSILINKRLRNSLERTTVTGMGMCPEHQRLRDEGYIAVVACDEKKSEKNPDGTLKPEKACRTGDVAHVKREAFSRIFNVPAPDGGVMFCEPQVIEILKEIQQREN